MNLYIFKGILSVMVILLALICACSDNSTDSKDDRTIVAQSNFQEDADGWTRSGDGIFTWRASGGNPGGFMRNIDPAYGSNTYAIAPEKFLGSWTSLDGQGTLSYDYRQFQLIEEPAAQAETLSVTIEGPGGYARAFTTADTISYDTWVGCSVPIDEANWEVMEGTWSELIAEIEVLRIDMELINGVEESGIDNVMLFY